MCVGFKRGLQNKSEPLEQRPSRPKMLPLSPSRPGRPALSNVPYHVSFSHPLRRGLVGRGSTASPECAASRDEYIATFEVWLVDRPPWDQGFIFFLSWRSKCSRTKWHHFPAQDRYVLSNTSTTATQPSRDSAISVIAATGTI